jgi:hypothetical protein
MRVRSEAADAAKVRILTIKKCATGELPGIFMKTHTLGSLQAQSNDAHDADTKPSTLPTRWAVRKLARVSKRASAAMITRPTRLTLSPASPTTSSSLTFLDLSVSTTPPISHGCQR